MSKPLAFVLQIAALVLILSGVGPGDDLGSWDWANVTMGLALVVVAGVGVRRRFKRG